MNPEVVELEQLKWSDEPGVEQRIVTRTHSSGRNLDEVRSMSNVDIADMVQIG